MKIVYKKAYVQFVWLICTYYEYDLTLALALVIFKAENSLNCK